MSGRSWTAEEIALLRRKFATTTNAALAELLGRSAKSVINQGAVLGLTKSSAHRARLSRQTALAHLPDAEEMKRRASVGGKIGGVARAAALTRKRRVEIAKAGGKASAKARRKT